MAGLKRLTSGVLSKGVVDGPDDIYCPEGALLQSEGFEYRRGYARTEYGRQKTTTAEIEAGARISDVTRWVRADGTTKFYALVNGYIYEAAANTFASAVNRSEIEVGASTATRVGNVVTIAGAKCLLSAQAGDVFYYDDDGDALGVVATVDSDTQVTLTSFAGSSTSGAFTMLRVLSTGTAYLEVMGDRLWVFDGVNIPHWYGDRGDGTLEFRPAGLPAPTAIPTVTLAAGGALGEGDYYWAYSFEDRGGRVSNPIYTHAATAATDNKATLANILNGPSWATKVRVWRTKVNGSKFYSTYLDYGSEAPLLVNGTPSDAVPSVITLATGSASLIADQHIHRYATFATSGNTYRITDNAAGTVTVATNASTETTGDRVTITGGYDIDQIVSSGFVDLMADGSLDTDYQEPTENTQPVAKLTHPISIDGGGRWMAYEDDSQTKEWFSGRNTTANIETGAAAGGLGEFDYAPQSHEAGVQDGHEIIQNLELGGRAFALKDNGPWEVFKDPIDVSDWDINPSELADGIGIIAPRSVAKKSGVAYWYGMDAMQTDIIRFDGNVAYGMMRHHNASLGTSRLRAVLDSMTNYSGATGAMFQGRYYLSFATTGTTNNKTLRFDIATQAVDVQPWGCGVFSEPYNSANTFILMCASPSATASNVFSVLGTQADNAASIARVLIPKAFTFGIEILTKWTYIYIRGINGETVVAPTVSYSVDGLPFGTAGKSWETTTAGETWRTTAGEYVQRRSIEVGEDTNIIHVKITSTDAKDWGIREIQVLGAPAVQPLPLGV